MAYPIARPHNLEPKDILSVVSVMPCACKIVMRVLLRDGNRVLSRVTGMISPASPSSVSGRMVQASRAQGGVAGAALGYCEGGAKG